MKRELEPLWKENFLAFARNEYVKFDRCWHVVENLDLGAREGNTTDRDSEESLLLEKEINIFHLPALEFQAYDFVSFFAPDSTATHQTC